MSLRKPLVIVAGQIEQLQSGDTLSGPFAEIEGLSQTSGEAGGIVIGTPVYSSAIDTVKKAQADASGTVQVIGIASSAFVTTGVGSVQTSGVLSLTTQQWDAVMDTGSGGLAYSSVYYLDTAAAGKMSKTASDTVGKWVVRLGVAISTTELLINIKAPVLL